MSFYQVVATVLEFAATKCLPFFGKLRKTAIVLDSMRNGTVFLVELFFKPRLLFLEQSNIRHNGSCAWPRNFLFGVLCRATCMLCCVNDLFHPHFMHLPHYVLWKWE
jgi:hypothetical protein